MLMDSVNFDNMDVVNDLHYVEDVPHDTRDAMESFLGQSAGPPICYQGFVPTLQNRVVDISFPSSQRTNFERFEISTPSVIEAFWRTRVPSP